MRAMDLKHHDTLYNGGGGGGRPNGGASVIKSEPRSISPCYSTVGNRDLQSPPSNGSAGSGSTALTASAIYNGISKRHQQRIPDEWLSPRSPATSNLPSGPSSAASNLSTSPGPALHAGVYPSTSNGYPSPVSYDTYISASKMSAEDLSPTSQNGYLLETAIDGSKKKKGPTAASRQQEELCLVCGDRASGYHYNALTCEGCKGFFRRSITKNAVYQCKYGNHCDIDMYMRRKCQECRLKKCLSVGMRPECVVPEQQCLKKRNEKRSQKDKDKPNSTTNGSPETIKIEPELLRPVPESVNGIKPLTNDQERLIHDLVCYQEQYEDPPPEDLRRVFGSAQDVEADTEDDLKYRHMTELTILTVQLIVEFAKRIPGFEKLDQEDKITLLKACSSEVMMLRMARKYDYNTNSIVFANNQPYTKDSYIRAGMGETIDDLLRFCRQMWAMKVDNAEYALLTAIVIFSGRPGLNENGKVETIQEYYIDTLKSYVDNRTRPNSTTIFPRLLSVLTELRTLGNQNFETCLKLKLKSKVLPPFLSEIWDLVS